MDFRVEEPRFKPICIPNERRPAMHARFGIAAAFMFLFVYTCAVACSGNDGPEDAPPAGCSTDNDCKGNRICVSGECVFPGDVPEPDASEQPDDTAVPKPDEGCAPQCLGKECGDDGCGEICGQCPAGTECTASGACGPLDCKDKPYAITGSLMTSAGELAFDSVEVLLHHKVDVDAGEDGCIGGLEIVLKRGTGCTLTVEAAGTLTAAGALLLEEVEFSANSQCADFPDPQEGDYFNTGGMTTAEAVLSTVDLVPDNVPDWCFLSTVTLHLEGTLYSPGAGSELTVDKSSIVVAGNFLSLGDSDLMCPCVPDCQEKECGGDGCVGDCGKCPEGPYSCLEGVCECQPQCVDKECGADECEGDCGTCSQGYSCDAGQCLPDGTCSCDGKVCGDDGCGESCGECPPGPHECVEGSCVCTPQCEDKECGNDGCGGECGSCDPGYACSLAGECVPAGCEAANASIGGEFATSVSFPSLTFDAVEVSVTHKMDIDEFEDGCISTVEFSFKKGTGCTLTVLAGETFDLGGLLEVTAVAFEADSQCPGFPDAAEGWYLDDGGLTVAGVETDLVEVPTDGEESACFNNTFKVHLEGILQNADLGPDLEIYLSVLEVQGDFISLGNVDAACPCQPSCDNKECGNAGCGYVCGDCECGEKCQTGQCIFTACDDKECGGDGCGGICAECACGENCENGQCMFNACDSKDCGDDGCGGNCGSCGCGEECSDGLCNFTACEGVICGIDGCGGSCGSCPQGQGCSNNQCVPVAEFGEPCDEGTLCLGFCLEVGNGGLCTVGCIFDCPDGWQCAQYGDAGEDMLYLCIPEELYLCVPCNSNSDCMPPDVSTDAKCVSWGSEGAFCGIDCSSDWDCPGGYGCLQLQSGNQCVPDSGQGCSCSQFAIEVQASTSCNVSNEYGACYGQRTCTWWDLSECDAPLPGPEECNGADDDCDGSVDEELGGTDCFVLNVWGTCPGVGLCQDGVSVCDGKEPAEEACDGGDNDCDGQTDEEFPDTDGDGVADCLEIDKDGDGVLDDFDNCPALFNPSQADFDLDALGNACDLDDDNDQFADTEDCAPFDEDVYPGANELCDGKDNNCNFIVDEGFLDGDSDGWKDCVDPDDDNDGAMDEADNCPSLFNPNQLNTDGFPDGGDACDPDDDNDGLLDWKDNCPIDYNPLQTDTNNDGIGDACE